MKKPLIILFLLLISTINLSAQEIQLYNDSLMYFSDGDTICANRVYYIDNPVQYQEIVIKDAESDVILEVYNSNSSTLELVFPENAGEVEIVITDYNESGKLDLSTEESINFVVEPCEYEVIKSDYTATIPYASFDLSETTLTVTPPTDVTNYKLTYKFVDQENGRVMDEAEPFTVELEENTVLQFTESFTNSEGEEITNYYELEVNPATNNFFVRNVDSFSINTIDFMSLINFKVLFIMLITFVLLIYFIIRHKNLKRKIKRKQAGKR